MSTKYAFTLKHSLLEHELNLKRAAKEVREGARRKANGLASYVDVTGDDALDWAMKRSNDRKSAGLWASKELIPETASRTIMKRHQNRFISCYHCSTKYLEANNHAELVHTILACIVWHAPAIANLRQEAGCCSAWLTTRCGTCCESVSEGTFESTGCQRRWHIAKPEDAAYTAQHEALQKRDAELMGELQAAKKDGLSEFGRRGLRRSAS